MQEGGFRGLGFRGLRGLFFDCLFKVRGLVAEFRSPQKDVTFSSIRGVYCPSTCKVELLNQLLQVWGRADVRKGFLRVLGLGFGV